MRAIILTFIISSAFLFNGCALIDRFFAQNVKKETLINKTDYQEVVNEKKVTKKTKKLASGKLVAKKKKYTKKYYTKKRKTKKYYAKKKRKKLYSKKKRLKKYYSKRKKYIKKFIAYEPYSLEKNELDPELLGPQTTFTNNPLIKKKAL